MDVSTRGSARELVFVTEKFPWPVDDGGQARTYHVLRRLAASVPTVLVGNAPPAGIEAASIAGIEELGVEVEVVGARAARWSAPAHAALATFTRAPHPIGKNRSRRMLDALRRRVDQGATHVHFNHLDAAQYVERLGALRRRVRCVFDTHNVLTTMYQRFHETAGNPLSRAYLELQWMKMNRFERAVMKQMDLVCVCSDVERDLLRTWGVENTLVVPNGVDVDAFTPIDLAAARRRDPPLVVFTGAMGYAPNSDAARWFLDAILPELAKLLPRVLFRIVGKDPPQDLLARSKPGEVELTGRVDDVRPFMSDACVFVCPLRIGGGTRLKILDAMAQGLPVVSTTVGAEGLAVTNRHDVELADDPASFARAIAELVRDERRAFELARNGRALVEHRYGWDGVVRPLIEWMKEHAPRA